MNQLTIEGTLTRDPEIRYTRTGMATTQVWLTERWQHKPWDGGDLEDRSLTVAVEVTGDLAENVALSFTKGHRVTVTGHLEDRPVDHPVHPTTEHWVIANTIAASLHGCTVDIHKTKVWEVPS